MTVETRLGTAWALAHHARREHPPLAVVSIRVGQDVWDFLTSLATEPADERVAAKPLLWGFPIVLEASAAPDHIVVRTDQVIA